MELSELKIANEHVSIFCFSDVHEGNENVNYNALKEMVKIIKETSQERAVKVIGLGDYIDAINIKDPRFSSGEIGEKYKVKDLKDLPRKQAKYFIDYISDIAPLITHMFVGNHEESYIKHGGFDVYDYLCSDLMNVKKMGYSGMIKLKIGTNHSSEFILCGTHGSGGAGYREGYALNNMFDIFRKFRANFYLMGHTHKLDTKQYKYLTMNQVNNIVEKKEWYGNTGCFLDTYKEGNRNYFEGQKGGISELGFIEIKLDYVTSGKEQGWKNIMVKHEL